METITTQLAPRFVVQYTEFLDGGRGGGATYGDPEVVAITNTLGEAFEVVAAMGHEADATVLEVWNPIILNGKVTRVAPTVHPVPKRVVAGKRGPIKKKTAVRK